jgi:large subunit ribosomal protein L4e
MSEAVSSRESAEAVEHAPPHHRTPVLSLAGKPGDPLALPDAFSTPVRPDLVRRSVVAAQSHRRQPHGTSPTAGVRHSVEWSGKGKGVARTPRLMGSMRGAQAPNTVGGRPAHPPRTATIWTKKINETERRLAFASALAATREGHLAAARGHEVPEKLHLPVVIENKLEEVTSTSEAQKVLSQLKLWHEVERARDGVEHRSGRARRRGRGRRVPRGLLIVTSAPRKARGFSNLPGVDVVPMGRLSTEDLAPGGEPGRLTLFTPAALEALHHRLGGPNR